MYQDNSAKNISNFSIWFLPIIIAAKIARWTIMYKKLVAMSIGNGMISRMMTGSYRFSASVLSQTTSASSVSETNAGALFNLFNVFGIHTTTGWEIYISIAFNIFLYFIIVDFYKRTPQAGLLANIFVYLGVAILNIFCFCLSKEPYQFLFFILMAAAIKTGKNYQQKSILLTGAIFLTVLFSRKYYGLVLIYFFILQYFVRHLIDNIDFSTANGKKKLVFNLGILAIFMGACYFFILSFLSANNEDTYQEMMNVNYRDMSRASVADSEIVPFFSKGNRLLATVDYIIKIFRLMFPIELLLKGKITYIFLVVNQGLLALFIRNAFITRIKVSKVKVDDEEEEEDVEEDEESEEEDEEENEEEEEVQYEEEEEDAENIQRKEIDRSNTRTAALYLYLAFLLCSASFEPDFGSWIRHQGVALPVMLLIL